MNLVALEGFANAVGPRQQVENIGRSFEVEEFQRLLAGEVAAAQHPLTQGGDALAGRVVNCLADHG